MTKIVRPERIERAARRIAPSIPRGRSLIIDASGRRRLTRSQKVGVAGVATLAGVALLGVVAGLLLDRLLDFDDALDAGGEWDEGGGVFTRWQ
ncbi:MULTISPECIES: hypothetical protein [Brevundimonas]|jgi:hypothetical protein|uniref:Uncharacterized protein n=2 Tax=Brevundimonas TaxID=41275 RepID=A0A2X1BH38_BREVE|nr:MULTISPECIES: hypothetical protein [Brevundimonas]MEE2848848.1 hypothetical protein [Pseudomonadota bacterium]MCW0047555.1 hypothetical protein [Brevundimonas sp. BT-123]MDQ1194005.1 hypothetical protein [Brevundimonas vesicularis]WOB78760.1 hypothetical protein PZA08_00955 [Brevundimonas nasdae]SPU55389.1 Uncharacterised protein [Brevundimonas vesicularis]